jgi:hypothetical protein
VVGADLIRRYRGERLGAVGDRATKETPLSASSPTLGASALGRLVGCGNKIC